MTTGIDHGSGNLVKCQKNLSQYIKVLFGGTAAHLVRYYSTNVTHRILTQGGYIYVHLY